MPSHCPGGPAVVANTLPSHRLWLVLEEPPTGVDTATQASVNETLLLGLGSHSSSSPLRSCQLEKPLPISRLILAAQGLRGM